MKPMSAARLRAEAAFASIETPPVDEQATAVSVSRPVVVRGDSTGAATAQVPAPDAEARTPRTFRITPVNAPGKANTASGERVALGPDTKPRSARKHRSSADRRPGVVIHVIRAAPPTAQAVTMSDPPLATLHDRLAPVGTLLAEVARAQMCLIDDRRFEGDWHALALHVAQLQRELQKLLR
jgi:hypothetical protein